MDKVQLGVSSRSGRVPVAVGPTRWRRDCSERLIGLVAELRARFSGRSPVEKSDDRCGRRELYRSAGDRSDQDATFVRKTTSPRASREQPLPRILERRRPVSNLLASGASCCRSACTTPKSSRGPSSCGRGCRARAYAGHPFKAGSPGGPAGLWSTSAAPSATRPADSSCGTSGRGTRRDRCGLDHLRSGLVSRRRSRSGCGTRRAAGSDHRRHLSGGGSRAHAHHTLRVSSGRKRSVGGQQTARRARPAPHPGGTRPRAAASRGPACPAHRRFAHRRVQLLERLFLDHSGETLTDAAGTRVLVDDQQLAAPAGDREQRVADRAAPGSAQVEHRRTRFRPPPVARPPSQRNVGIGAVRHDAPGPSPRRRSAARPQGDRSGRLPCRASA